LVLVAGFPGALKNLAYGTRVRIRLPPAQRGKKKEEGRKKTGDDEKRGES